MADFKIQGFSAATARPSLMSPRSVRAGGGANWYTAQSAQGLTYYYNDAGAVQWERPKTPRGTPRPASARAAVQSPRHNYERAQSRASHNYVLAGVGSPRWGPPPARPASARPTAPASPRQSFMSPRAAMAPNPAPLRSPREIAPGRLRPKKKTEAEKLKELKARARAKAKERWTTSHQEFFVSFIGKHPNLMDPDDWRDTTGADGTGTNVKTPRERELELMAMDPGDMADELKKLTFYSNVFHTKPQTANYCAPEAVLLPVDQSNHFKPRAGDHRPAWKRA